MHTLAVRATRRSRYLRKNERLPRYPDLCTVADFVPSFSLGHQKVTDWYLPTKNNGLKVGGRHRRRMELEGKAKVVASVWGQNVFNSLPR